MFDVPAFSLFSPRVRSSTYFQTFVWVSHTASLIIPRKAMGPKIVP